MRVNTIIIENCMKVFFNFNGNSRTANALDATFGKISKGSNKSTSDINTACL